MEQRKYKIDELNATIDSLNKDIGILNNQIKEGSDKYVQSESIIKAKDDTINKQDELFHLYNDKSLYKFLNCLDNS